MAHSWVQMFNSEYDAFKTYCEMYPDNPTLLVDTYNTLKSGVPNAIKVFKEVLLPQGKTKFKYGSALSGTDNSVSLCRNESLMIDCEEKKCFNKLSFNCRRFDCHNRLVRENRSSLGNCINITAEFEVSQILKKLLVKNALALRYSISSSSK